MKTKIHFLVALMLGAAIMDSAADLSPFGIVYGPKAGFNIAAPEGWVIDNNSGAEQGLPCVLYRKGDTWENADPLMYAKIASTSYEDAEAFAKTSIEEMKRQRGEYKERRVESGKTKDGHLYFVNEYSPGEKYPRYERVAYIQLPKAVAYVVYTADKETAFRKHQGALQDLLKSFRYLAVKQD
jgi:hypothetical protein